jgi:hypothetical protein
MDSIIECVGDVEYCGASVCSGEMLRVLSVRLPFLKVNMC